MIDPHSTLSTRTWRAGLLLLAIAGVLWCLTSPAATAQESLAATTRQISFEQSPSDNADVEMIKTHGGAALGHATPSDVGMVEAHGGPGAPGLGHATQAESQTTDKSNQPTGADANAQPAGDQAEVAQESGDDQTASVEENAAAKTEAVSAELRSPKDRYGLWALLPAGIAILLAIFTRQVVPALVIGVLVGAYMMVPCLVAGHPLASLNSVLSGFRLATEDYIFGAIIDTGNGYGHAKIIVFTLVIGFTVGVIGKNGGTEGMVRLVAGKSSSPRRGALTAWLAGLVVFFDDYANTMIVGPTMRSVFDRLKLSRAKLAYIVDSTAAPVASIALIGTWIGAEIGFIQQGIDSVTSSGVPSFLTNEDGGALAGMQVFLSSIPYRFYPILALWMVFLIAFFGRDFGPMKHAERKAKSRILDDPPMSEHEGPKPRWLLGLLPVLALVATTVAVLIVTGRGADDTTAAMNAVADDGSSTWAAKVWWDKAATVLSSSDSYLSIFHGAVVSAFVAVILTILAHACPMKDAVEAGLDGMSRMFPAVVILVLAWALSGVMEQLQVGQTVADRLDAANFPPQWLPLAVFLSAAGISFATGTSWGTMGILCPVTVVISVRLMGDLETSEAISLFYASVGSVLAGAVFGDHCSPISDTTVLSSIASGCPHEEHVWTQLPYAVVAAVAAMGLGDVMCSVYKQPWWLGLLAGAGFLFLVVLIFGRRAVGEFDLADA